MDSGIFVIPEKFGDDRIQFNLKKALVKYIWYRGSNRGKLTILIALTIPIRERGKVHQYFKPDCNVEMKGAYFFSR